MAGAAVCGTRSGDVGGIPFGYVKKIPGGLSREDDSMSRREICAPPERSVARSLE